MSTDNTIVRSMHDLGLSAWFGGSLMGAVGVNGAADDVHDPTERLRVASSGWARWAPVNALAIGVHLVGAVGMLVGNADRVRNERGVGASSAVKTVLTGAALAATAYSGWLGSRTAKGVGAPAAGGVQPSAGTPDDVASAQRQLRIVQWVLPALTGALTVISAAQGEQQRPEVGPSTLVRKLEDTFSRAS